MLHDMLLSLLSPPGAAHTCLGEITPAIPLNHGSLAANVLQVTGEHGVGDK